MRRYNIFWVDDKFRSDGFKEEADLEGLDIEPHKYYKDIEKLKKKTHTNMMQCFLM